MVVDPTDGSGGDRRTYAILGLKAAGGSGCLIVEKPAKLASLSSLDEKGLLLGLVRALDSKTAGEKRVEFQLSAGWNSDCR